MPGVCKDAIDWMTRPAGDIPRVLGGKPGALIGASPGRSSLTGALDRRGSPQAVGGVFERLRGLCENVGRTSVRLCWARPGVSPGRW
ncbi:MAG: hypothetical protein ABTQ27_08755 [Amaricoccus sp.]|uniref:hypothetical protein n=1 Tax=Amaricoccus sp. TaxID=1872485 RepID=UPI0033152614